MDGFELGGGVRSRFHPVEELVAFGLDGGGSVGFAEDEVESAEPPKHARRARARVARRRQFVDESAKRGGGLAVEAGTDEYQLAARSVFPLR